MAKILIAEDEVNNMLLIRTILQRKGFEVIEAVNGKEAISLARLHKPDLILMDMWMPIMDGYMATEFITKDDELRHIPVMGLSAHARQVDIDKAMKAGCVDYETKPVNIKTLHEKILNLLAKNKIQQSA